MSEINRRETKHAKGRGSKYVYDILKKEILSLKLEPGTPLDEMTLSERFSMSRSPVREALVRLSAEDLVVTLSNRSTLVAPINMADFPRYVEALDVMQRLNTRLAAMHRLDEDIEKMERAATDFEVASAVSDLTEKERVEAYFRISQTNKVFHMAVAAGGKNPYLALAYGRLLDEGRRLLHMHFHHIVATTSSDQLSSEHREMIKAIRAQDAEKADHLAHLHTKQFHDRFIQFMTSDYNGDLKIAGYAQTTFLKSDQPSN